MMRLEDCRYDGHSTFNLADYPTSPKIDKKERPAIEGLMANSIARMIDLQNKLNAQGMQPGVSAAFGRGDRRARCLPRA